MVEEMMTEFDRELLNFLELSVDYLEKSGYSMVALRRIAVDAGCRVKSDCSESELLDSISECSNRFGVDTKPWMVETFIVGTYLNRKG